VYHVRCAHPGCTFEALDKDFDIVADALYDHHFEEHGLKADDTPAGAWDVRQPEPAEQAA